MKQNQGYHRLQIVEKLKIFIKRIYLSTEIFPKSETFGLTSQIRRAAVSVLLNIVEGERRKSNKEFLRFLEIADASLAEVEVALELSLELGFLNKKKHEELEEKRKEIAYMLIAFIKKLKVN